MYIAHKELIEKLKLCNLHFKIVQIYKNFFYEQYSNVIMLKRI